MYLNQITIVGNVTRDAEVFTTRNGKEVIRFAVAVNRGKDQPTDFFEVACWEKPWALDLAKKGALILIQGPMRSNRSEDGITYWTIFADKVILMNSRKKETEKAKASQNKKSRKKSEPDYEIYVPENQVPQYEVEY